MSQNFIQPSFSAGELSPTLYARVDFAKYHVGLAKCRNFFVDYRGGASTRTGTLFAGRCRVDNLACRLIPFQFSSTQELALQFGDFYMRVVQNGALILNTAKVISAITQTNPGVFTSAAHGFTNGQWVFLSTINGMSSLNSLFGIVASATVNTFQLTDLNGVVISTLSLSAYTGGGTAASVFELSTPYAAADLALIKFTQSADVMTLTHPSYASYDLARLLNTSWTLTAISIGSTIAAPANPVAVMSPATVGTAAYAYVITAVNAAGDESIASTRVDLTAKVDMSAVAGAVNLTCDAVTGAVGYNFYKAVPVANGTIPVGVNFGYIGSSTTPAFVDGNIVADFTTTPPTHQNPFTSNNPGVVAYFQQRKGFFGSLSFPESFWFSKTGQYKNFDYSSPVQPDDAITATLVSSQLNAIEWVVGMPGGLIVGTSGGAWQVSGGSANAPITPGTITATPQAYNGASTLQPLVVNYDILYVQAQGSSVRDLSYNFYTNIYTGTDISILSNHLFYGYTIPEWTYAQEPFKMVWAVRSDGHMLSCTFVKEQELIGWAQHDTLGKFKSVISIKEGAENFVYCIVQREIQGVQVQYIERFASRLMPYGVEDAWAVDCGLTNTLTYPAAGLSADGITGTVNFEADAVIFSPADVGKTLRMGGGIATITAYVNAQNLTGTLIRDISAVLPNSDPEVPFDAASGDWSLTETFDTFSGLDHLEGQTVAILGDGNVFTEQVVTDGSVTLNQAVSKIVVGLPFTAQMQTLYLDVGEPTIQGKRKKISAVSMRVDQTRGLATGPTFDSNEIVEFKMRDDQPMGTPIALETGDQRVNVSPLWATEGQICIEQSYPLPATVLGIVFEYAVGDTK